MTTRDYSALSDAEFLADQAEEVLDVRAPEILRGLLDSFERFPSLGRRPNWWAAEILAAGHELIALASKVESARDRADRIRADEAVIDAEYQPTETSAARARILFDEEVA